MSPREPLRLEDLPELLNVDELQQILRLKRSKAYEIARRLRVQIPGLGRVLRVRRSDIERIVNGEAERPALRAVR